MWGWDSWRINPVATVLTDADSGEEVRNGEAGGLSHAGAVDYAAPEKKQHAGRCDFGATIGLVIGFVALVVALFGAAGHAERGQDSVPTAAAARGRGRVIPPGSCRRRCCSTRCTAPHADGRQARPDARSRHRGGGVARMHGGRLQCGGQLRITEPHPCVGNWATQFSPSFPAPRQTPKPVRPARLKPAVTEHAQTGAVAGSRDSGKPSARETWAGHLLRPEPRLQLFPLHQAGKHPLERLRLL